MVVPAVDSHCLTEPPPPIPGVVSDLAALPPPATGTRAQLDALALYTAELFEYARRAWRDCGTQRAGAARQL